MALYILRKQPFEEKFINNAEIFNESVILFLTYILWAFSDYQDNGRVKFDFGWLYSTAIVFCVFVNILLFLIDKF